MRPQSASGTGRDNSDSSECLKSAFIIREIQTREPRTADKHAVVVMQQFPPTTQIVSQQQQSVVCVWRLVSELDDSSQTDLQTGGEMIKR